MYRKLMILAVGMTLLLVVGMGSGPGTLSAWQPTPTPAHPGGTTLSLIEQTIVPTRDRIDLARRLLGVTDIPAPPTVAPPEHEIGDVVTFWAGNVEDDSSFQLDATLVYKTDHVYMFVENGYNVDLAAIQRAADTFENKIRPKVHEVFGSEWFPGIDGDPHLYVLHADNLGSWVAAYYDSSSQYPRAAVANSNEHEMFFVNLDTMYGRIGTDNYEAVLAHEFQHMVHWAVDLNEDTWLNEGLSELSAMITGYGVSNFAYPFLETPDIQLNDWPEDGDRGVHYGAAFMFVAYFYDRYGEAATTTLVSDPANGMASVEDTLAAINATDPTTGAPVTAEDLFADWLVANLLQNPTVGDGRYAYHFQDMAGLPSAQITQQLTPSGTPVQAQAPQWGANYLYVPGGTTPQQLRFSFQGSPAVSIVPADAHSGQYMWWSNRADESDSRLTRAFDLTDVTSATLDFWTWYYIEHLWDYGYVMVSTDGGATWTPLETTRTTADDPHNNAYGPGYTGQSDGWVQESVDLTPYAGQDILVRFEYITDDAVTQPGMLIDDVSIPELGYVEDFENGDGSWVSEGWLWTDNVLPQRFVVQLVQPGNPDGPVTRWLSSADAPQGEWDLTVGGEFGNAAIVVSGLAPITTESAAYQYTLSPVQ
jgi:immune inhibitor A